MSRTIGISSTVYLKGSMYEDGWEARFSENCRTIRKKGFDCIDYQHFVETETPLFELSPAAFRARLREERKIAEDAGLTVWQTHSPWRCPPRDLEAADRAERLDKMCRALEGSRELGAGYMAIHPMMPYGFGAPKDPAFFREINLEFFRTISEKGKAAGVVVCLENLPAPALTLGTPAEVKAFTEAMDTPWLRICLDTGHANTCAVGAGDAVRLIGKDLLAVLHIHDNDGTRDSHWTPGFGTVDWADFRAALDEIGFDGCINLETNAFAVPAGRTPPEDLEGSLLRFAEGLAGR